MVIVRINCSWPEIDAYQFTFTLSEGVFGDDVPRQIRSAVFNAPNFYCGFEGGDKSVLVLGHGGAAGHRPAQIAFRVLKGLLPEAVFQTYVSSIKQYLGDDVNLTKASQA